MCLCVGLCSCTFIGPNKTSGDVLKGTNYCVLFMSKIIYKLILTQTHTIFNYI